MTTHSPRPPYIGPSDPITGSGKWQSPPPGDNPDPCDYYVLAHLRLVSGKVTHKAVHTNSPEDWIRRLGRNRKLKSYRWSAATSLETLMYGRWLLELQATWNRQAVPAQWFCPSCRDGAKATMTDELAV